MFEENLEEVQKNIANSCIKTGREEQEVQLIAVSKTKPVSLLMEAYNDGVRVFGENKAQEIVEKYDQMPSDVKWHMIGHLQTNKVKYIIDKVAMIHSVDSMKLAKIIDKEAKKHNISMNILIEVNVAREDTKFGIMPEDLESLIREISVLSNLNIKGLMTIAPYTSNPEKNRGVFKCLNKLSVDIDHKNIDNVHMGTLSMGMTGDYQVAIEEGATMVRVGTGLFGARNYAN
ncbi:MAG: YggS family pyridoxal phosphate-dependent enzyme [Suipraeoptans sp.]